MHASAEDAASSGASVLVTGAAGFIGSAVVRHLLDRTPHRVISYDALTYAGGRDNLPADHDRHTFIHADVTDAAALAEAFACHRPTAVLHLAAESHVDRSIDGPATFIHTNLVGTYTLLEATRAHHASLDPGARERFRLVHVSTDEVFGSLGPTGTFHTTTPYDPRSPYSASKAGSDHLARAWHHTYDLPIIITNCSNNYGPRQYPEKLIPHLLLRALHHLPLPIYGDGSNIRDWLHVDDHARGLVTAALHGTPGATYLFGGNSERTNLQVVHTLCTVLDELHPDGAPHARLITFVRDRPGHDHRYAIDASSARDGLDWAPSLGFEDGLRATVEWYLANLEWCERRLGSGYGLERLGARSAPATATAGERSDP